MKKILGILIVMSMLASCSLVPMMSVKNKTEKDLEVLGSRLPSGSSRTVSQNELNQIKEVTDGYFSGPTSYAITGITKVTITIIIEIPEE